MTILRRLLGIFFLLFGLVGLYAAYVGVGLGQDIVQGLGTQTTDTLDFVADSLTTVTESLIVAKDSLAQTQAAIVTTEETAVTLANSVGDSKPLIQNVSQVVTQDLPESLEAVQTAVPNLATAAQVIDTTLRTLDSFGVNQSILGIPLNFDLGIDYDPEQPLDQSINELGTSLDGVPEELTSLRGPLAQTADNLTKMEADIKRLSGDVGAIAGTLEEFSPQVDQYVSTIATTQSQLRDLSTSIGAELARLESAVFYLMVWFALLQILPIVYGFDLLFRRGEKNVASHQQPTTNG